MTARRGEALEQLERLTARNAALEAECSRLSTMVAVLQHVATAAHVSDAMVTVTRQLGESYALDRSSILLIDQGGGARIVASHEDPSIRSLTVDLSRYPEVRKAITTGTTVFLPDATAEPMSWMVRETLRRRNVASAIVVPIMVSKKCVGALFIRTRRDQRPVTPDEITFFESVAKILANAFAKARTDAAINRQQVSAAAALRGRDSQRIALVAFLERLLSQFKDLEGQAESVANLTPAADADLERMLAMVLRAVGNGVTSERLAQPRDK